MLDADGLRRRARPRRPPGALPRAGRRGGGDDRDRRTRRRAGRLHRRRWHAEHRPAARRRRRGRGRCSRPGARRVCDVVVAGCITKGRAGEELAPMGELYDLGVRVFTDDGDCVADAGVMRRAFEYAALAPGRGARAARRRPRARSAAGTCTKARGRAGSASPGRPAEAESSIVGARPRSSPSSPAAATTCCTCRRRSRVELVRRRQGRGARGDRRGAPHHFTLTDAECASFDPVFKVNPPLRTDADVAAITRRARRRHDRRDRHRPRARTRPRRRRCRSRRHRRGCSGSRPRSRSRSPSSSSRVCSRSPRRWPALSWRPARDRRPRRRTADRSRRAPRQPLRDRPGRAWVVDRARLASRSRNSPVGRLEAHRAGAPHDPRAARPVVDRRGR